MKNISDKSKKYISGIPVVRWIVLKLLKFFARDITIKNPYTGDDVLLNLYRHKSYWYFGAGRERASMNKFHQLISAGYNVVELGGHIGFISQYFSKLVGNTGSVLVFEPGANNLPYIKVNLGGKKNIKLIEKAISNQSGYAVFYEDNISGQNNSLLEDYKNVNLDYKNQFEKLVKTENIVEITTLDDYLAEHGMTCDFIKIDIEGYELYALMGMPNALKNLKSMMVEVRKNQEKVFKILIENGFTIEDEYGNKMMPPPLNFKGNIFAIKMDVQYN